MNMNKNTRSRNNKPVEKLVNTNYDITHPKVRLLDKDRQFIGIMSGKEANIKAKEAGLDLIELAANATPPVCFIGNADKYVYELKKKEKEKKKGSKTTQLKEIHLRPNIAENDAVRKMKEADKFLSQGNRVQIVMEFRGREKGRIHELSAKMTEMVMTHIENGSIEGKPSQTPNRNVILLVPVHKEKKDATKGESEVVPVSE